MASGPSQARSHTVSAVSDKASKGACLERRLRGIVRLLSRRCFDCCHCREGHVIKPRPADHLHSDRQTEASHLTVARCAVNRIAARGAIAFLAAERA